MKPYIYPAALPRPMRRVKKALRVLTSQIRLMPDFIIIGAQKCGTTSLYKYLTEHPCIVPASRKGIHFFDKSFVKGMPWYRAHFASALHKYYVKQIRGRDFITGESSPYYIFHPHVPKRVSETIPQVKLIVLLRNPIDRAYSHYHHEVSKGNETLSFEDATAGETERLDGERERMLKDGDYYSFNHEHYSYLSRGIYVDQLKLWMSRFPKDQILILKSEDFYADPATILKEAIRFLNLPTWEATGYAKYNTGSYPKMDVTVRKRLIEHFEPHNQRLYEYLGANLGWDT